MALALLVERLPLMLHSPSHSAFHQELLHCRHDTNISTPRSKPNCDSVVLILFTEALQSRLVLVTLLTSVSFVRYLAVPQPDHFWLPVSRS